MSPQDYSQTCADLCDLRVKLARAENDARVGWSLYRSEQKLHLEFEKESDAEVYALRAKLVAVEKVAAAMWRPSDPGDLPDGEIPCYVRGRNDALDAVREVLAGGEQP